MANAYGHRLGQIIGDSLEIAVEPFLRDFAEKHNLYLDKKEYRNARAGTKVTWEDINHNTHDLDFVLEKGGTQDIIGKPVAFIECAWRRYTKHSKNKAQEIQGAIMPLFEKYKKEHPFVGVILAGDFTHNSLLQLKSLGFSIMYIPYEKIIKAFAVSGIDVFFQEDTDDAHSLRQIELWERLAEEKKQKVYGAMTEQAIDEIKQFLIELDSKICRSITKVRLWMMFGQQYSFDTIKQAKEFIITTDVAKISPAFCRYEAEIEFSNGDIIKVVYHDQNEILSFLSNYI